MQENTVSIFCEECGSVTPKAFLQRSPGREAYPGAGLPRKHNPEIDARFKPEARAAAALNNPNIITIHDIITMPTLFRETKP